MPTGEPKKKGSMTPMRDRISQAPSIKTTVAAWAART